MMRVRPGALIAVVLVLLSAGPSPALDPVRRPILPRSGGLVVEITAVRPLGPAHRAGLEVGDRILEIDGVRVKSLSDLHRLLVAAGEHARLNVQQRVTGKTVTVHVYPEDGRIGIDARLAEPYPDPRYPY